VSYILKVIEDAAGYAGAALLGPDWVVTPKLVSDDEESLKPSKFKRRIRKSKDERR
jgi:hypothetical protein